MNFASSLSSGFLWSLTLATTLCAARAEELEAKLLSTASAWQKAEFGIRNVPPAKNPFDPDEIKVDALFTAPSGARFDVPAFWFQNYERSQADGGESLKASGEPEWRIRFTPT